jgi:predicted dehydrogenase
MMTAGAGFLAAAMQQGGVPLAPPDKQPPDLEVPPPPKEKAGWAVIGLGEFGLGQIVPSFAHCERSRLVALVSGHPDKAERVARRYGVDPKTGIYDYENYDTIRDNPDVDVVYVILPTAMHAEYTIRGARAGKHVMCEKPMATSVAEAQRMIDACREADRKLMIGYRLRYEPYNQAAIEMCRKRAYGPMRLIDASNVQNVDAPNIRLSRDLGGGPLGDTGIYCINAARYLTGEEPVEVTAVMERPSDDDPRFREVPRGCSWTMRFPSGVLAHCGTDFAGATSRRYRVHCQDGYIDLENAFAYNGLRLKVSREDRTTEIDLPQVNQFAKEMDHFSACVLDDQQPWTPGEEGLADMKVIAAIEAAAREGKTVRV